MSWIGVQDQGSGFGHILAPQDDVQFHWVAEVLMMFKTLARNQFCALNEPIMRAVTADMARVQQPGLDDNSLGALSWAE